VKPFFRARLGGLRTKKTMPERFALRIFLFFFSGNPETPLKKSSLTEIS
jgi:hypothetical protein